MLRWNRKSLSAIAHLSFEVIVVSISHLLTLSYHTSIMCLHLANCCFTELSNQRVNAQDLVLYCS